MNDGRLAFCAEIIDDNPLYIHCKTEWGDVSDDEMVSAIISLLDDVFNDSRILHLWVRAIKTRDAMSDNGIDSFTFAGGLE